MLRPTATHLAFGTRGKGRTIDNTLSVRNCCVELHTGCFLWFSGGWKVVRELLFVNALRHQARHREAASSSRQLGHYARTADSCICLLMYLSACKCTQQQLAAATPLSGKPKGTLDRIKHWCLPMSAASKRH